MSVVNILGIVDVHRFKYIKKGEIVKILSILVFLGTLLFAGDGMMVFKVSPKDAKVYVDGKYKGEANGLVLSVKEGNHQVEIKKGNDSKKKSYFVPSDGIVKVILSLNGNSSNNTSSFKSVSSSYGYVKVLSQPKGMKIFLNGKYAGKTPAKRIKVDSGDYKLVLKDPNNIYTSYKEDFKIKKFGLKNIEANMKKGTATIFFIGDEEGYICNDKVPGLIKVTSGKSYIEIKGNNGGYKQNFNLKNGEEIEVEYSLKSNVKIDETFCDIKDKYGNTYKTIVSPYTGKIWLDRNLGAKRVCQSYDDSKCFGYYFQWGRGSDGHEEENSSSTKLLSHNHTPNHSKFILAHNSPNDDWLTQQNDNLWQGIYGINNPCPHGFRLPTISELAKETTNENVTNMYDAYRSFLKLPASGQRFYAKDNSFENKYKIGQVWSSSVDGFTAESLYFFNKEAFAGGNNRRAYGIPVRCLKD